MSVMGLTGWIAIITAALKFPDAIMRFVVLLQKTPQEQHEALLQAGEAEAASLAQTGRPSWN